MLPPTWTLLWLATRFVNREWEELRGSRCPPFSQFGLHLCSEWAPACAVAPSPRAARRVDQAQPHVPSPPAWRCSRDWWEHRRTGVFVTCHGGRHRPPSSLKLADAAPRRSSVGQSSLPALHSSAMHLGDRLPGMEARAACLTNHASFGCPRGELYVEHKDTLPTHPRPSRRPPSTQQLRAPKRMEASHTHILDSELLALSNPPWEAKRTLQMAYILGEWERALKRMDHQLQLHNHHLGPTPPCLPVRFSPDCIFPSRLARSRRAASSSPRHLAGIESFSSG